MLYCADDPSHRFTPMLGSDTRLFMSIPHSTREFQLRHDLLAVTLVSLLAAVLAWFDAPVAVRLPFGLLAVLFLPGYSLIAVLFPRPDDLTVVERLALSI